MAWTSFPERNAEISRYISYGPVNKAAIPVLETPAFDGLRNEIPISTHNLPYAIFGDEDLDWQIGHDMGERWVAWQRSLQ